MNFVNQFIQLTVQRWKARLGIRQPITIFTDSEEWLKIFPKDSKIIHKECAITQKNHNAVFINTTHRDHFLLSELEDTIVHELCHLRYKDKDEMEITELSKRLLESPI